MISKLTKEQELEIPKYLNYWLSACRRTTPVDKEKATRAIDFFYEKVLYMKKPKQVIFLDSPMACQLYLASHQLRNQLGDQLRNQLDNQLRNQLDNQLWNQLRNQLMNQLYSQLGNQLRNQLMNQLYSQLGNQLWNQLGTQLYNFNFYYYFYYHYILNVIFPEKQNDFSVFLELLEHLKEIHSFCLYEDVAIVSDFPISLQLNAEGKLHSDNNKAIEYRDGWGFYASEGKCFETLLEALLE
jgi:hypothetical protein